MFAKYLFVVCASLVLVSVTNANPLGIYVPLNDKDTFFSFLPSTMKLQKFEDSLYYFGVTYKGNFFQSMDFCKYHGMDLLSIETKEENNFIFDYLQTFLTPGEYLFWSSGIKTEPDNQWVWTSTGRPMTYMNWLPGQPSNAATERYMEIRYTTTNRAMVYNDQVPTQPNYVICETMVPKTISL